MKKICNIKLKCSCGLFEDGVFNYYRNPLKGKRWFNKTIWKDKNNDHRIAGFKRVYINANRI